MVDDVRSGGHDVPVEIVRRRYRAGLRNFFSLYEALASTWRLLNGSRAEPSLIAERLEFRTLKIYDEDVWTSIKRQGTS